MFDTLLSPSARAHLDATRREVDRLYGLPNRWLAEALLRLARDARDRDPQRLGDPLEIVYGPRLVWHIVPEVARRLAPDIVLKSNESSDPSLRQADASLFRSWVGHALFNAMLDRLGPRTSPTPADLLCHEVANGNPVAFGMDRVAPAPPPGEDRHDPVARHLREISQIRGFEATPYWSPRLQIKHSTAQKRNPVFRSMPCP